MADESILRGVGPVDVDSAGELVKRVGVHHQAKRLIKSVGDNFPPEVVAAGSRRLLGGRSQTLDLAEVADAASETFPDYTELLSAKVRGSEERPDKVIVNVVCRSESGRSFRGILPYASMKKSQKAYDEGVKAGTIVMRPDDPEANQKALEEAQKRIIELTKQVEDGSSAPPAPPAPVEPFPDYADAKAADIVEAIEAGSYDLPTLFAIKVAEAESGQPRETVQVAVDEKIAAAEAALETPSEPTVADPYDGYSTDGAKEIIAKVKDGDLTLTELLALKTVESEGDARTTVLAAVDEKIAVAEAALKSSE